MTESVLRYFADFLPLAARVAPIGRTIEQIHAAHAENAGADPAALGEDAAVLRHVLIEADAQWQEQARMARALPDFWRGDGAAHAHEAMLGNIDRAESALAAVREAVEALEAGQTALADANRGRADAIGCLPNTIDGRSAPAIAVMVDRAIESSDAECRAWLDEVFLPHVHESLEVFDDICGAASDAVASTLGVLDRTLAEVDERALGLAAAALAGAGGIVIAAGELALTAGAELVDELAADRERDESEESAEVEASPQQGSSPGSSPAAVAPEYPPSEPPRVRNEPAIAVEQPEPDAAQADSSPPPREPLLASAGDEESTRNPEVQLGEAGPL
ncbi:hypothetical protein [Aldersonia kunmingensis]|uniref:hypothetical protein n=1 Tax=Aldersonia kunmingensis TaxID=408066 RepID=UPI000835FEA5|nr:hypothetical protein [Aldersonia kunmingensis]